MSLRRASPAGALVGLALLASLALRPMSVSALELDAYDDRWRQAATALAAFALTRASTGEAADLRVLAPRYRAERERFAASVAWLSQTAVPPGRAARYWRVLPLYEQALAAMGAITTAAERGDAPAFTAGWALLRDTARLLRTAEGPSS